MKAILEFNLNEPEDREDFETAVKAQKYKRFAESYYDEVFRKHIKYDVGIKEATLTEAEQETLSHLLDALNKYHDECMND